jgi:hypothetical protein
MMYLVERHLEQQKKEHLVGLVRQEKGWTQLLELERCQRGLDQQHKECMQEVANQNVEDVEGQNLQKKKMT